jgi:hypothetical protein
VATGSHCTADVGGIAVNVPKCRAVAKVAVAATMDTID